MVPAKWILKGEFSFWVLPLQINVVRIEGKGFRLVPFSGLMSPPQGHNFSGPAP